MERAWPAVCPDQFIPGFHIDAICDHLQAVSRGQIQKLIINVPPRHSKSTLVSVLWPAWEWIDHPEIRWLFTSHGIGLSTRDSVACRRLVQSIWYQAQWGYKFKLVYDQNEKRKFENDHFGVRLASSVGAAILGDGGDRLVCDDPNDKDDLSDTGRQNVIDWWDGTMSTRLNDARTGCKVIIQQRLHENDLTGHLLQQGGYEHLILPAEYDPRRSKVTSLGWKDPRTSEDDLLDPIRHPKEVLDSKKIELGSFRYAGQFQQSPAPAGGGIVKQSWWRYYREIPERSDPKSPWIKQPLFDELVQSWDFTFKGTDKSDYVVGQLWGRIGIDKYLVDQARGQWDFVQSIAAIKEFTSRPDHATGVILIEEKANGAAIISALRKEISGIVSINPKDSKEARVSSVSPDIESGHIFLPDPQLRPWVNDFVLEFTQFPRGSHDDQVDAATQALKRFRTRPVHTSPMSLV